MFISDQRGKETDICKSKGMIASGALVHVSVFDAFENVCSDTCAFMGSAAVLRELQIPSGPLSQKRRGKR